jgi:Sec7-like guanine-nucleotide exchange factor
LELQPFKTRVIGVSRYFLFHSDIVYGILFSIVLLNTDLNTVNIGSNKSKKMSQKDFIKNTWDFIVDMVEKEDLLVNQEYLKKNYKKFELILKVKHFLS